MKVEVLIFVGPLPTTGGRWDQSGRRPVVWLAPIKLKRFTFVVTILYRGFLRFVTFFLLAGHGGVDFREGAFVIEHFFGAANQF